MEIIAIYHGSGDLYVLSYISLADVRKLEMYLVAFAEFLRCDELIKLKCSNFVINVDPKQYRVRTQRSFLQHSFHALEQLSPLQSLVCRPNWS